MLAQNGTLRLVAANPEPSHAESVGVGATVADAKAAAQTALNNLQAVVVQIPNNASLVGQLGAYVSAVDDWATAIDAASSVGLQNLQNTVTGLNTQLAAQQTTIKTLQDQLKAAGITPNVPGTTTPQHLPTTTPAPAAPTPGTFTTGQTAAATVFGAIAGWFGHEWYDQRKRS